jgi:hypothetical protein
MLSTVSNDRSKLREMTKQTCPCNQSQKGLEYHNAELKPTLVLMCHLYPRNHFRRSHQYIVRDTLDVSPNLLLSLLSVRKQILTLLH